jgi:hypothetical protein
VAPRWTLLEGDPEVALWTDDFTNLVQVLRWKDFRIPDQ